VPKGKIMARTLQEEIAKKQPFDSPEIEAFLNILRTSSVLKCPFDRLFKHHGISSAGYNVLRILKAAGEDGATCSAVGKMLVASVPDVTRLIDRLTEDKLVDRKRETQDRRVVMVKITPRGLALLDKLLEPLETLHKSQLSHMSATDLQTLSRLLELARSPKG
jgi:DNA-binding MarR family transcriptional regulator